MALLVSIGLVAAVSAQQDAGTVQQGGQQSRDDISEIFDQARPPEGTAAQLAAAGWAALQRGEEAAAEAAAVEQKKRKKLERRAGQAYDEGEQRFLEALQKDGELVDAFIGLARTTDAASVYPQLQEHAPDAAPAYLDRLRSWGQRRAAEGDEDATNLLAWIEEQG